ncbi:MAG: arginase [Gemmatimonadota bacterium]|nr:arginase [Gemmatimonadota bacterium]MDH5760385.1 arginase [Gemmatimonadota bacterium]
MTTAREVALISVSMDLGAGRRGVDMGPSALRIAGLTEAIEGVGHSVFESGTVTAEGFEGADPGHPHARFLQEIERVCGRTGELVHAGLSAGLFPLVLGGDHALAMGTVSAVARYHRERGQSVGLIWVDAHADMNTPETTPSGNVHGMPLAALMGVGHPRLVGLHGDAPAVHPRNVSILAARDVDEGEKELIRELGVRVFTMSEIDERGVGTCMGEALERASDGTAGFHLSFDLDALDPRVAPGVGTPVQGGLTYREAHLVCEMAARSARLVGLEVVELNPVLDEANLTARLAVGLVASALGQTIL